LQTPIEFLLVGLSIHVIVVGAKRFQNESMRQIGLVEVSCRNILLAAPDLLEIGVPRLVRMKGYLIEGGESSEGGWFSVQPGFPLGQPVQAFTIELFPWFSQKPFYGRAKNNLHAAGLMIDGGDDVIQTELQMGEQQIVLGNGRKCLILAHEVVAEVADGSAKKMRQTWRRLDPRAGE
jgi:hypothetical protein